MVNLLADMGIQPGTLEAGLVAATQSTDTTKPVSTITAPNDGTALKVGNAVTITGTASDVGGVIAGGRGLDRQRHHLAPGGWRRNLDLQLGCRQRPARSRSRPGRWTTASIWRRRVPAAR